MFLYLSNIKENYNQSYHLCELILFFFKDLINNFDKIIFQNYLNNCWWIGNVLSLNNDNITIDNSIYLQRNDGLIYNASPMTRTIKVGERDTFFIIL